jgi:ABC-2 type transport system permease protein
MSDPKPSAAYFKFGLYLLVVVLINVAGITLFARLDLTRGQSYSLSEVSRKVVSSLSEPLTINVFFSRNLPAPYNTVEQYLRDLLEEYAVQGNRFFNYRFYDVSAEEGDIPADARENQKLASTYGIHPIQVQVIEKDEVKFQRAYMGLVLIHGDLIEQIPTITTTDGLEYRITTAVQKMNDKISVLLRLSGKIQVKLFLSPALSSIAPLMGLKQMPELPGEIEKMVSALNAKTYGKLEYRFGEPPADERFKEFAKTYNLLALSWPASNDGKIPAGKGAIGLVVKYGDRKITLPLIDVVRVPIIGTQYKLLSMEELGRLIDSSVESLIDINSRLGVLADRGAAPLAGAPGASPDDPQAFGNLRELVARNYAITPVRLSDGAIPEGIACLMIVNPREKFSDFDLYLIDQFLMQGKSLALFPDAFEEAQMPGQAVYTPIETGLDALLEHYGVRIQRAFALDEHCYRQEMPAPLGGGERPIYYAPLIKTQFIDQNLGFMKNIRSLVAVKVSPLELLAERAAQSRLKTTRMLATSERSWEVKPPINLNPMTLRPPAQKEEMHSRPIAYLLEGNFPSFFAGKPLPIREAGPKKEGEAEPPAAAAPPAIDTSKIERRAQFIEEGKPGRIFLMASSEMLRNVVVDESGRGANTVFALNVIDYLNGREGIAVMRGKEQKFNPLQDTSAGSKTFIKSFAIAGLPVLVALFGAGVWFHRTARKKRIRAMFAAQA